MTRIEQVTFHQVRAGELESSRREEYRGLSLEGTPTYLEIEARSVLNRVKAMMPLNWTINPYRGCRHACVYCFARPSHKYFGLNAGTDFHNQIFVKVNAASVLRQELARPGWKGEEICLGSATDPYQPAETRYRLSRQILEVIAEFRNPLSIITKSHLVLEDLDWLVELSRRTRGRLSVSISLTTLDEAKARLLEPGAPSPARRLETIAHLAEKGIKTRLFVMPVVPGITDQPGDLDELVKQAVEAGVQSFHGDALRIARGLEGYFYSLINQYYPELKPRYRRIYGRASFAAPAYREALKRKMTQLQEKYLVNNQNETERLYEHPADLEAALEAAESETPGEENSRYTPRKSKLPLIERTYRQTSLF